MKSLRYICLLSLALAAAILLLGILAGFSAFAADIVNSYAGVLFATWAFFGVIVWFGGFAVIARCWHRRTTVANLLNLFLLFSLNVFFAYYLILRSQAAAADENES